MVLLIILFGGIFYFRNSDSLFEVLIFIGVFLALVVQILKVIINKKQKAFRNDELNRITERTSD